MNKNDHIKNILKISLQNSMRRVKSNSKGVTRNSLAIDKTESTREKKIIQNIMVILWFSKMNTLSSNSEIIALPRSKKMECFFKFWLVMSPPSFFLHLNLIVDLHLFYICFYLLLSSGTRLQINFLNTLSSKISIFFLTKSFNRMQKYSSKLSIIF